MQQKRAKFPTDLNRLRIRIKEEINKLEARIEAANKTVELPPHHPQPFPPQERARAVSFSTARMIIQSGERSGFRLSLLPSIRFRSGAAAKSLAQMLFRRHGCGPSIALTST